MADNGERVALQYLGVAQRLLPRSSRAVRCEEPPTGATGIQTSWHDAGLLRCARNDEWREYRSSRGIELQARRCKFARTKSSSFTVRVLHRRGRFLLSDRSKRLVRIEAPDALQQTLAPQEFRGSRRSRHGSRWRRRRSPRCSRSLRPEVQREQVERDRMAGRGSVRAPRKLDRALTQSLQWPSRPPLMRTVPALAGSGHERHQQVEQDAGRRCRCKAPRDRRRRLRRRRE